MKELKIKTEVGRLLKVALVWKYIAGMHVVIKYSNRTLATTLTTENRKCCNNSPVIKRMNKSDEKKKKKEAVTFYFIILNPY